MTAGPNIFRGLKENRMTLRNCFSAKFDAIMHFAGLISVKNLKKI